MRSGIYFFIHEFIINSRNRSVRKLESMIAYKKLVLNVQSVYAPTPEKIKSHWKRIVRSKESSFIAVLFHSSEKHATFSFASQICLTKIVTKYWSTVILKMHDVQRVRLHVGGGLGSDSAWKWDDWAKWNNGLILCRISQYILRNK